MFKIIVISTKLLLPLNFTSINDAIGITLLGQEALAVLGKILIDGVARNHRIETSATAVCFRAQDSTKALGFFLARTKCS